MSAGRMQPWDSKWAVTALLMLLATPAAADKLEEVEARGKLVVGVSDTTPPFSFRKLPEDAITGYDIDLVKGVAKRMGSRVDMVTVSSAERIPLLQQDKLDLVATSMTPPRERLREI